MVKATWVGDKLVVTKLTEDEESKLPEWVAETVEMMGIAVHDRVAYSSDEKTAREKLEF
jgi:hypothetical protein